MERGFEPDQSICLQQHGIKPAWRGLWVPAQKVFGCKHNAPSLDGADAATRSPKIVSGAGPDLHEHQGAIAVAHNQVNFAAASPRRAVITGKQGEALVEQIPQGALLGSIAALLGVGYR